MIRYWDLRTIIGRNLQKVKSRLGNVNDFYSEKYVNLLLTTAWNESKAGQNLKQRDPERFGLFGITQKEHAEVYDEVVYNKEYGNMSKVFKDATGVCCSGNIEALETNLAYQVLMGRCLYMAREDSIFTGESIQDCYDWLFKFWPTKFEYSRDRVNEQVDLFSKWKLIRN